MRKRIKWLVIACLLTLGLTTEAGTPQIDTYTWCGNIVSITMYDGDVFAVIAEKDLSNPVALDMLKRVLSSAPKEKVRSREVGTNCIIDPRVGT